MFYSHMALPVDIDTGGCEPATIRQILDRREQRANEQLHYLHADYSCVISFTLNIPGIQKSFPLALACFKEGLSAIREQLQIPDTAPGSEYHGSAGHEIVFPANIEPAVAKKKLLLLEQKHALGRLWDIDVIAGSGAALSRRDFQMEPRRCLLCGNNAKACARSRAHTTEEVFLYVYEYLNQYYRRKLSDTIADCAYNALLDEVSTTPKPGLVDRRNTGSHADMTYDTFVCSAQALRPFFERFADIGYQYARESDDFLFSLLRKEGLQAEAAMLHATNGINTHKGAIFSLALLCGAAGALYAKSPFGICLSDLSAKCASLAKPSLLDFSTAPSNDIEKTAGMEIHQVTGCQGIRGEATGGYPHVFLLGYPSLKHHLHKGLSLNDASLLTLLTLIAHVEDTNMIRRGGLAQARQRRAEAAALLCVTEQQPSQRQKMFEELDDSYIKKNLSPGGCADLLALSIFLVKAEHTGLIRHEEQPKVSLKPQATNDFTPPSEAKP